MFSESHKTVEWDMSDPEQLQMQYDMCSEREKKKKTVLCKHT